MGISSVPSGSCACMYTNMHRYCVCLLSKKKSVNILQLLKTDFFFLQHFWYFFGIFYSVCHLSFKSFFLFQKNLSCFEKSMSIEGGLPHKEPQGLGPTSSFQLSGPGGKRSGGSYKGWGTACGVGGFCEVCFGWVEKKLYFTKFENNLTPEGVVVWCCWVGGLCVPSTSQH